MLFSAEKAYPLLPPRLEAPASHSCTVGEVLLEPRSLLVISGEAYELYVHRIDHAKATPFERRIINTCYSA